MNYRHILAAALLTAGAFGAAAAPTQPGSEEFYRRAVEMYGSGNYVGAADQIGRYLALAPEQPVQAGREREYAEVLLLRARLMHGEPARVCREADLFIEKNGGSPLVRQALWLKAEACFYTADYAAAAQIYKGLPFGTFSPADDAQGRYHYAVALTELGVFSDARTLFSSLRSDSEWGGRAEFYLGYLDYVEGNYDGALAHFSRLTPEVASEQGADFFKAQALFAKGRYSEVSALGPKLLMAARQLERGDHSHEAEAYRLIGESAYATGDKSAAQTALTRHCEMHTAGGELSARYLLGVMAYEKGRYSEADEWLLPAAEAESSLGQSATLYLGQTAARRGDNTSAAIYFDRAAHQPYDGKVAETALYNYAAAVVGGGRVPFGSASTLLEEFGTRYPDSKYVDDVDKYLAIGYLAEKRYLKALEKLDRIKHPGKEVRELTRQTLYELGSSELAAGDAQQAERYLRRAVAEGGKDEVSAASRLWLAEALYAQKKYKDAAGVYKQYVSAAPSGDANRGQAYYDMAYALYQLGDYKACKAALDEALKVKGKGALPRPLRTDAMLRRADCDNYLGNVREALTAYSRLAGESDATSPDYAALQAACMQGILGDEQAKRTGLEAMLAKWPGSHWAQQALYELADACMNTGDFAAAAQAQERLRRLAPDARLLRESKLQMAEAYAEADRADEAVAQYKHIIESWPSSVQAEAASVGLQAIYSSRGELNALMEYLAKVPGAPQPEASELDRLTYVNAISALERDPHNAAPMEDYAKRFPQGRYMADALLAMSSVYRDTRNSDKALQTLDDLLVRYADSDAALSALLLKGEILSERGEREQAEQVYRELLSRGGTLYAPQAYEGLMKNATDPEEALKYTDKYLGLASLDIEERVAANALKADFLVAAGRPQEALALLKKLAADTRTPQGGAAAVKMARIYLQAGYPQEAEKQMLAFTDQGCDDLDCLASGYIVLAEAYAAQGNKRRARQYLESLSENYPGDNQEILTQIATCLKAYK